MLIVTFPETNESGLGPRTEELDGGETIVPSGYHKGDRVSTLWWFEEIINPRGIPSVPSNYAMFAFSERKKESGDLMGTPHRAYP